MTDHPTPGSPLSADDVGLLKRGDVLRHEKCGFAKFYDEVRGRGEVWLIVDCFDGKDAACLPESFTFVGRPDADGWIAWSGGENPVPGVEVEFRVRVKQAVLPAPSGTLRWHHWGHRDDIIAFRLSLPTDRRAEANIEADLPRQYEEAGRIIERDTPPSAGPDAGLVAAWRALEKELPDSVHDGHSDHIERVAASVQSVAAALEAAAEREGELRGLLDAHKGIGDGKTVIIRDLEAQVAALREALEGLLHHEIAHVGPYATQRLTAARQALSAIPTPGRE